MKDLFCYKITYDNTGVLSGRTRIYYIISESMTQACELANSKKYFQHVIVDCELMGDAITPDTPKFS
jgi:hypothetical protein